MTKEELREHCEKQVKMCEEWAKGNNREPSGKTYEEHKLVLELIKASEQSTSDDCVSRKSMLDAITEIDDNTNMDIYTNEVREIVNELPPVTPTHGTCKDCKHNYKTSRNTFECSNGHRFYMRIPDTFYCADYEKRGNEE